MRKTYLIFIFWLPLGAYLTGCVAPQEPLSATTDLSTAICGNAYALSPATFVSFEAGSDKLDILVDVDQNSPCIEFEDGRKSSYAVFNVQGIDVNTTTIVAGSQMEYGRIMAPLVITLSLDGKVLRRFSEERFLYRGNHLSVSIRPTAAEAFVVVLSNSETVGKDFTNIKTAVDQTVLPVGAAYISVPSSADTKNKIIFSHHGIARLRVYHSDMPNQN